VNTIVDEYVTDGQLNDSGLTLGDVQVIRTSFIDTLKGRFHIRVKYPGNEELAVDNLPDGGPPIREETPADERGAGSDGADANGDAPVAAEPDAETQEAA
jgi:hypothetical protein